eukprot:418490-Alexandrium_andersonii.AAC.1
MPEKRLTLLTRRSKPPKTASSGLEQSSAVLRSIERPEGFWPLLKLCPCSSARVGGLAPPQFL